MLLCKENILISSNLIKNESGVGVYKIQLSTLQEVDVAGKKAIVLFVPVPQLRAYQKIQVFTLIFLIHLFC